MDLRAAQRFTSLAELLRFYSDADEIVFKSHCELEEQTIADLCREARRLAHRLRLRHGVRPAAEIARLYGVEVVREERLAAAGQMAALAERTLHPPRISLQAAAIRRLAKLLPRWVGESERVWFIEPKISEAVTAHELYHIIQQHAPSPSVALAAHAFARAFAELPFSPLLYHVLAMRLAKGRRLSPGEEG
jgi:hypothetical protein